MVPFERAFVTSYSNFSSIFTRFRDIADFVLQHATFSYPTSSQIDGHTDRRTDDMQSHYLNTALCTSTSRGKNC